MNAVITETFEYCVFNTNHLPSSAFTTPNLMPSEYSKHYFEINVDKLEYSIQNRLGLLFYYLLVVKYYSIKTNKTNYTLVKL